MSCKLECSQTLPAAFFLTAWLLAQASASAVALREIYSFQSAPSVQSTLVAGSDGAYYGTTGGGGANGFGSIFRITTNGTFTTLVSFAGNNGSYPSHVLAKGNDGAFYGTTAGGGSNGYGTVFRVSQNGKLSTLAAFNQAPGISSLNGLCLGNDGAFYGTTLFGGSSSNGTVFRVTTNGSLTLLASFGPSDGTRPLSRLVQATDGAFYGTTARGGTFGYGTAFRVTTNGALTTLASFDGTNGASPQGDLVQAADGSLYGTAWSGGGDCGLGTIFRLTTAGELTALASFGAGCIPDNGWAPQSGLLQGLDGAFYGTTSAGGALYGGTIFRATTNGDLSPIVSFDGTNESEPYGGLVQGGDGAFYGTTYYGGSAGYGTVFRATTNGDLTALASFTHPEGVNPTSSLIQGRDGSFYGTTYSGGDDNKGTIFRVTSNGLAATLVSFYGTNGSSPAGGLVQSSDGSLYGTTTSGGDQGNGTVFRMTLDGLLTTLVSFAGTNGASPRGALLPGRDGAFYGTTTFGGDPSAPTEGTVFRVTTNGQLTGLAQFASTNASDPNGDLVQASDGSLYGTTAFGPITTDWDTNGAIFRLTTNGDLTIVVRFAGPNGAMPRAGLIQGADSAFYGTTSLGGANGLGTVFRVTANGDLTTLIHFAGSNGAYPYGGLIQDARGAFYGTTAHGGVGPYGGYGTVFRITTNGALTTLASFDGTIGASPLANLLQGQDGSFYGVAASGGSHGGGSIFQLSLASVMQPPARAGNGWLVSLNGIPGDTYALLRAPVLSGPWQTLTNITAGLDGTAQYLDATAPPRASFYRATSPLRPCLSSFSCCFDRLFADSGLVSRL